MRKVISWLMILGLCLLSEQAAAAGTVLTLAGQPQQIAPGETLTLTADLSDAQNLYGFELHLRFDPTLLQLIPDEASKAATPGALLAPDFVAMNAFDNAEGTVDYAATQISPHKPVSGSGQLLQMKFTAVASGKTRVEIGSFTLSDIDGLVLAATATNAEVNITGSSVGSDPPATSTPMVPSAGSTSGVLEASTPPTAMIAAATSVVGTRQETPAARAIPTVAPLLTWPVEIRPTPTSASTDISTLPATPDVSVAAGVVATPAMTADAFTPSPTPQRLAAAAAAPAASILAPTQVDARTPVAPEKPARGLLIGGLALLIAALALAILAGLWGRSRRPVDVKQSKTR
jgi:hypothetical protein